MQATSKAGVWETVLADGTKINVRSVTSSVGRWTLEVINNPQLKSVSANIKHFELKFK